MSGQGNNKDRTCQRALWLSQVQLRMHLWHLRAKQLVFVDFFFFFPKQQSKQRCSEVRCGCWLWICLHWNLIPLWIMAEWNLESHPLGCEWPVKHLVQWGGTSVVSHHPHDHLLVLYKQHMDGWLWKGSTETLWLFYKCLSAPPVEKHQEAS